MRPKHADWILMTGATGFVGPALACELLARGRRLACLVRATTPAEARQRLVRALRAWTEDVERLLETGRLIVLRGDVHRPGAGVDPQVRARLRGCVGALVHAAGNTGFRATAGGEPHRTNVDGTRHVCELARALGCTDWHLISTAYVAGATTEAREAVRTSPPAFHNAYEQSKWEAEHLAIERARETGAALTIYRPSIVVGHSETGRVTRCQGIYHLFRAISVLARMAGDGAGPRAIPLRILARPDGRPNLICIDDVARAFGELFDQPAARGGVYHLTHPLPPTNARIKRVLEDCYGLTGGTFADDAGAQGTSSPTDAAGRLQELFDEAVGPIAGYLFDAPRFDRSSIERFVSRPPAPWTDERLRLLIEAAEQAGWHPSPDERYAQVERAQIAAYFREYLPRELGRVEAERVAGLDLSVRFCIGADEAGRWWCRFAGGRVAAIEPAAGQPADVVYRTSEPRFWAAVSGEISGAELFLSGEAQIEGDIERALKFATVLDSFVRKHPYRPALAAGADPGAGRR